MTPEEHAQKTARELEWPLLLEQVAARCQSEVARRALSELEPAATLDAARVRMLRTREAMLLNALAPLPTARIEDQLEAFEHLEKGAGLDAMELRALGVTLELAERLRAYLGRHAEQAPTLRSWLATSPALGALLELIQRSIGPDGAILDAASSTLRRARQRAQEQRQDLRRRLTALLGRFGDAVQGQYVAERDGRYVLPVRADAPFRVDGLVLGSSASGGTLYVEPTETHELGNAVQLAEAEVRAEEARVLREISLAVTAQLEDVRAAQRVCLEVDCLRALAEYAQKTESIAFEPQPEPVLDLVAMRHPLLLGAPGDVVANDLALASGRGLILSGPNAGGKTVALKCLGLAAWMVRCGIPIPAAVTSKLGWFEPVLSDIGDNQSLTQSLSTFSAHMEHVSSAVRLSGPAALVLLDEVAGGTDPDEGAALACAVVEALVTRGAAVCVTTHYERLKLLAAADPRLANAAVGFDRERLLPTFRIEHGAPGVSSALLVAQRFGLEPAIITRAEALLPEGVLDRRALERELEEQRLRWQEATAEAQSERRQAAELRKLLEQERRRASGEERDRLTRETQSVLDEVQRARTRLREAEARLKAPDAGASALSEAHRAVNDAAAYVSIGGKLRKAASALDPSPKATPTRLVWDDLAPGMRVTLSSLGAAGHVVAKPRRDQVTIAVGSMKTTVNIDALSALPGQPSAQATAAAAARVVQSRGTRAKTEAAPVAARGGPDPLRTASNTINLVGQRVAPALDLLDTFVDGLLRNGEPFGFVLHGHGTGALKGAVREHLNAHRCITRAEPATPEDGGDAFTIMWIGG